MALRKSHDQKVAEAFIVGTLLPVLHASSDNGDTLRGEIIIALFGQVAFEDGVEHTNGAAGLLELAHQVVKDGREAGHARSSVCSVRPGKRGKQDAPRGGQAAHPQ